MESAGAMSKELSNWREVKDFYRRASELYIECGRSQPASDALAKGARALEDSMHEEAIQLYTDACTILEEDGGEQMAFDIYRAITSVYIKHEKFTDAASFLLRLGLAADKCNATNSQCKAYLSAIIVHLYAQDFKQAEKCYNDCSQIDAFLRSDHNRCASKLLAAFRDADIEEIRRITQSGTISNLDHVIIRLARKLPTGDVNALKADTAKEEEQPLDEDDLT
ncbi:Tetratricopeptide-like helical domain superfamily [Sesbania bispinosa]|nr:Tetratricopeptide-like helical domain superfamily [Sesbania bispinosa]